MTGADHESWVEPHVRIPMSDGVELDADLYLPAIDATTSGGRWPTLLWYDPYRKDDVPRVAKRTEIYLARRGFVVVVLDVRGTGSSGGTALDEYTPQEQADGVEAIAWLASQPWSNGNVGMYGKSYSGFNSLQIASHRPPALKAIAPMYFSDNRYTDDCHYKGGAMQMLFDLSAYGLSMVTRNALPPDPEAVGSAWANIWEDHLKAEPWQLGWIEHQALDDYWRNGSIDVDYSAIECATYLFGGWRDGYANTNLRTFERLSCPKKVLIGPWLHALPDVGVPGPRIDHAHELARFFEYWLNGVENGVMDEPPVTIYVQEYDPPSALRPHTTGVWRHESGWPLTRSIDRRLPLGPGGRLVDGEPASVQPDSVSYRYDPTAGTSFGVFSGSSPYLLPVDQREEDPASLTWTSGPLSRVVEILGRASVDLRISVSTTVATVVVRLIDVAPDGSAALVTKGVLNLTHRDSHERPEPMEPGTPISVALELDATSWVFTAGHRLRLAVNGADYPNAWPSPFQYDGTIHLGGDHGSFLTLPVIGPTDERLPMPDLRPARPVPATVSSVSEPPVWRVTRDRITGATEVHVKTGSTTTVNSGLTVRSSSDGLASVVADDPAHAFARGSSEVALIRPGQVIAARTRGEIKSDETAFHVTIELVITIDDQPFRKAAWARSFERLLL